MLELTIWVTIGFVSGSVPWAVLVGNLLVRKDVRSMGDGNPGAANAWKLGGWVPGAIALILDVAKSLVPVYLATRYLGQASGITSQISLALVAIAPVVGHGWSPFLHFKGGKALAASWGSWIAIMGGVAIPVAFIIIGLMHGFQKNHAITVTLCLVGFLVVFLPLQTHLFIALFWVANLMIIIWKHRAEYSDGLIARRWVRATMRALP